jgi:hypothetical protein
VSTGDTGAENKVGGQLDAKARQKIGHELRATYDDFREWELPRRLTELLERVTVDAYLTPEDCRTKALDCLIRADTLDDPKQKAAMLQYAEWWNRLAEYRDQLRSNSPGDGHTE